MKKSVLLDTGSDVEVSDRRSSGVGVLNVCGGVVGWARRQVVRAPRFVSLWGTAASPPTSWTRPHNASSTSRESGVQAPAVRASAAWWWVAEPSFHSCHTLSISSSHVRHVRYLSGCVGAGAAGSVSIAAGVGAAWLAACSASSASAGVGSLGSASGVISSMKNSCHTAVNSAWHSRSLPSDSTCLRWRPSS